jgi:hypothetical protein
MFGLLYIFISICCLCGDQKIEAYLFGVIYSEVIF